MLIIVIVIKKMEITCIVIQGLLIREMAIGGVVTGRMVIGMERREITGKRGW